MNLENSEIESSSSEYRSKNSEVPVRDIFKMAADKNQEINSNLVTTTQTMSHLQCIKNGLKACKGESGYFNPIQAFECLN